MTLVWELNIIMHLSLAHVTKRRECPLKSIVTSCLYSLNAAFDAVYNRHDGCV